MIFIISETKTLPLYIKQCYQNEGGCRKELRKLTCHITHMVDSLWSR